MNFIQKFIQKRKKERIAYQQKKEWIEYQLYECDYNPPFKTKHASKITVMCTGTLVSDWTDIYYRQMMFTIECCNFGWVPESWLSNFKAIPTRHCVF